MDSRGSHLPHHGGPDDKNTSAKENISFSTGITCEDFNKIRPGEISLRKKGGGDLKKGIQPQQMLTLQQKCKN